MQTMTAAAVVHGVGGIADKAAAAAAAERGALLPQDEVHAVAHAHTFF
jgi:hypothetical protein